jgi:hypothetical protein
MIISIFTVSLATLGLLLLSPSAIRAGAAPTATLVSALPAGSPTPASQPLPASGQRRSYPARKQRGGDTAVTVPDDGGVQAGVPLQYRDNGDGTITDLGTGLMWEKKCSGCGGLHDSEARYHWSGDGKVETIWDWLAQLNAEGGGFAGHSDWRIPNVKEMLSIIDFGRFDPAVAEAFDTAACEGDCKTLSSPQCSCTASDLHWTSTTFSDFPAHALIVHVGYGFVDDRIKTNRHHVRAVRGGAVPLIAPQKK